MRKLLAVIALLVPLAVGAKDIARISSASGRTTIFLTDEPCTVEGAKGVLEQYTPGAPQRRARAVFDGKQVEACWAPHAEPIPHVDVVGEDGGEASIPLDALKSGPDA